MVTFKARTGSGQDVSYAIEETEDIKELVEDAVEGLRLCLAQSGLGAQRQESLQARISKALFRDYLTGAEIDLEDLATAPLPVPFVLDLVPAAGSQQGVRLPFAPSATANGVIADLRAFYGLGPNARITLKLALGGQQVDVEGTAEVRTFPSSTLYWRADDYA